MEQAELIERAVLLILLRKLAVTTLRRGEGREVGELFCTVGGRKEVGMKGFGGWEVGEFSDPWSSKPWYSGAYKPINR